MTRFSPVHSSVAQLLTHVKAPVSVISVVKPSSQQAKQDFFGKPKRLRLNLMLFF